MTTLFKTAMMEVVHEGTVVTLTVHSDKDTSSQEAAQQMIDLAAMDLPRIAGLTRLVLDVSRAAGVAGPTSVAMLSKIFAGAEAQKIRVEIRAGPSALQQMQMERLSHEHAPTCGVVVEVQD